MRGQWSLLVPLCALCAYTALPCTSGADAADDGPISRRKQIFKHYGEVTKPIVSMIKRQQDYDPRLVTAALKDYAENARVLPTLFPPDSKTGGETHAKPAIWDDKAHFDEMFAKFGGVSDAASRAIVDEASFRATMPKVLGSCKSCHDEYREKD